MSHEVSLVRSRHSHAVVKVAYVADGKDGDVAIGVFIVSRNLNKCSAPVLT